MTAAELARSVSSTVVGFAVFFGGCRGGADLERFVRGFRRTAFSRAASCPHLFHVVAAEAGGADAGSGTRGRRTALCEAPGVAPPKDLRSTEAAAPPSSGASLAERPGSRCGTAEVLPLPDDLVVVDPDWSSLAGFAPRGPADFYDNVIAPLGRRRIFAGVDSHKAMVNAFERLYLRYFEGVRAGRGGPRVTRSGRD